MEPFYPILHLPEPLLKRQRLEETMGTKEKFWLRNPNTGQRVMVKYAREDTGEDWSEKLAHELARKLHVPCYRVDLFQSGNVHGVLCWDFLGRDRLADAGADPSLIHGNELLFQRDQAYPTENKYGVAQHTVEAVRAVLEPCTPRPLSPEQGNVFRDGFDTFVGYLMLDALIGNTDRHHENWGVVSQRTPAGHHLRIAPSYDHASSLGRELNDIKRRGRLDSSGKGTIEDYLNKAFSALRRTGGQKLTALEAFHEAALLRPAAAEVWKNELERTTLAVLTAEVEKVPPTRLSDTGKSFARQLLTYNYHRILETSA